MKRSVLYIVLLVGVLSMPSCTMYRKAVPVAPVNIQVLVQMQDLEYLGETTVTNTQSYVLGIPYGGRRYHAGVAVSQNQLLNLPINLPVNALSRGFNNAMYDALKQFPDADFIMPISYESKVDQMFLGRQETLSIKVKAYRIKKK